MIDSLRNLFGGVNNVWLGTETDYLNQVAIPLAGGNKNTFNKGDESKLAVAVKSVKVLGDNIGRTPVNILQTSEEGNIIDRSDYRQNLLRYSPDGIITSNDFFASLQFNLGLKGNAFARIIRNRETGKVIRLDLIPSNWVEGYKFVRGGLYYIYNKRLENKDVKKVVVNAQDMLHFKMVSNNGLWGINPIESQRLNMSTLYKAQTTQDSYYENNAFTPAYLKSTVPDANFIKPFTEAMKQFKDKNVGPANAGTIATLPPFTEIQQLTFSNIDSQFLASSEFTAKQICAWWDVPPSFVGLDTGTFKNIEELTRNFATFGLGPLTSMYRAELEFKLLTQEERSAGKTIEFDLRTLIETDLKSKLQYYKDLFNLGVLSGGQIALAEGLPLYEGSDIHFIPTNNLTPVEDVPEGDDNSDEDMDQDSSTG